MCERSIASYSRASLAALLVGCVGVCSPGCRTQEPVPLPPVLVGAPPVGAAVGPTALADHEQERLERIAMEYQTAEAEEAEASARFAKVLNRYVTAGGHLPPTVGTDLTVEQRRFLEESVPEARTISRRRLIQGILDLDAQLMRTRDALDDVKVKAHGLHSHVVEVGQRHDRIAVDYLVSRGVPGDGDRLVSQVALHDGLVPGFRVWTYHANGQFGTWVTKGTAAISPAEHQRRLTQLARQRAGRE